MNEGFFPSIVTFITTSFSKEDYNIGKYKIMLFIHLREGDG